MRVFLNVAMIMSADETGEYDIMVTNQNQIENNCFVRECLLTAFISNMFGFLY